MNDVMYDVISAGLIVADIIVTGASREVFDRDNLQVESIINTIGGDALNVAVNLSKLGTRVRLAGCLGTDSLGLTIYDALSGFGVNTSLIKRVHNTSTSTSLVLCEKNGERHFLHLPGANSLFDGELLTDEILRSARILYIGSLNGLPGIEGERLTDLLMRAKNQGLLTLMDACGDMDGKSFEHVFPAFQYVDYFLPSWNEASGISRREDTENAARFFLGLGAKTIGIKLGNQGVYMADGTRSWHIPAYKVNQPVDTTGAGDAFVAGFIRGLLMGRTTEECARMGCAAGSSCVRYTGATTHPITLESICKQANLD